MSFGEDLNQLVEKYSDGLVGAHEFWDRIRLADVARLVNGFAFKSGHFNENEGTPLLRIRDILKGKPGTRYNAPVDDPRMKSVSNGEIVIGMDGDFNSGIWRGGSALINQRVCTLQADERYYSHKLLAFALPAYLKLINDHTSSVTVKHLSSKTVQDIPLPLPPLNEQQRIVEKIETLFAHLDKGEEAVREVQKLLTRYRQSVLKAAVTGQLTADWRADNGAPEWKEICLYDVTEFLTSGSRGWAKYYADEGDIFVRAQNIKHDRLELDDIAYVSLPAKSEGKRTRIQKDDLLITITGANVTKTAHVDEDIGIAYVSQHVALFRPTPEITPDFLYWFLVAKAAGRKQLEDFAYGAGKPGLNLQNIRDVRLMLPSLEEQSVIVDLIRDAMSKHEVVETEAVIQLKRSASLRQSILKDAFAGRLAPQDPTDEPASALLARIAAEKPTAKKTGRKTLA